MIATAFPCDPVVAFRCLQAGRDPGADALLVL